MSNRYDAIVVGCGAMGSAACYHLASRGLTVLGIDRFDIPNEMGSSHGNTRLIRKAYFEDPRYVPLAVAAFKMWRQLERENETTLLQSAGCLNIGPPDHECIRGVRRSVEEHNLPHELLNRDEIVRRWPIFRPNELDVGVYESEAGILSPERCIEAQIAMARKRGATIHTHERVQRWEASVNGVAVTSHAAEYSCRNLVLCAGPWLGELAAELQPVLTVERKVQAWFRPTDAATFSHQRMPAFIHFLPDRAFFGTPAIDERGVKFGRHHGGEITSADSVNREPTPHDESMVRSYLRQHVPDADGSPIEMKVCLYTNTPDDHFVVGFHPHHRGVILAGGFSGHGFKFAPVIGAAIADLVAHGRTDFPIGLFAPDRLQNLP